MPFQSAISSTQQARIRGGVQSILRYVAIHTPSIVMQAQPSANATSFVNTSVPIAAPTIGALNDVIDGMTVILSPTSDYVNDLQTQPENCAVTYARGDGTVTASTLNIGETAFQYTTSDYATVVNDVRVFLRKPRLAVDGSIFMDYDIAYRKPKPRITGLYSDVVKIASGSSTANYAFSDVAATPMAPGATISTYAWDLDGGSFAVGTSSSQNPTGQFSAGTYMVYLKVTDSNSVYTETTIILTVLPSDLSSVVDDTIIVSTLANGADGYAAGLNLTQATDLSTILPGSMCMVVTVITFVDGTEQTTCDMVGWLGETFEAILADEQFQYIQEADIAILDIAQKMSALTLRGYYVDEQNNANAWFQLVRVTPLDALWLLLSELTTVTRCAVLEMPSSWLNQRGKTLTLPQASLIDVIERMSFYSALDSVQWSPNGEIVIADALAYATAAVRDAATTIVTLSAEDASISTSKPEPTTRAVQYVIAGASWYETTAAGQRAFFGQAPAVLEDGILQEEIDGIIWPRSSSVSDVLALTGRAASNHYFAANENLTVQLSDALAGYYTLRYRQDTWVKLDVSAGDLPSDELFDTNTRFLVLGTNQSYDADAATLDVSVNLREETGNSDRYSIRSEEILTNDLTSEYEDYPPLIGWDIAVDGDDIYDDDYTTNTGGQGDSGEPEEEVGDTPGTFDTVYVPASGEAVTSKTTNSANTYTLRIAGDATLTESSEDGSLDMTTSDNGGVVLGVGDTDSGFPIRSGMTGTYTASTGWEASDVQIDTTGGAAADAQRRQVFVFFEVNLTLDSITMTFDYTAGTLQTPDSFVVQAVGYSTTANQSGLVDAAQTTKVDSVDGSGQTLTYNPGNAFFAPYIYVALRTDAIALGGGEPSPSGAATLSLIGYTANADPERGDAFYWKYNTTEVEAYPSGKGLTLNGSVLSGSISTFDPTHTYIITGVSGTDAAFSFAFVDPQDVYTDNSDSNFKVEIVTE